MKKFSIFLTACLLSGAVNAQTQFGIHADAILASQSIKVDGLTVSSGDRFSWKAGLIVNVPASEQISFAPQLNLISKGSKFEADNEKTEFKLTYLEMPLNFVYNSKAFFFGAGPVLSYGLGGKVTDGTESADVIFDGKKEADVTDDNAHLNAFEFSGNILGGYKLSNGVFFKANYNFGISKINPDADGKLKNAYLGFGIGYFFSSSK